jgi:ApaG protein
VVGKQPVLKPGEEFDYSSFCPLTTPQGAMEGEFLFAQLDELGSVARNFDVKVGRFGLDADGPAIL